jgi:predicted nucleic acid-binding protein
VGRRGPPPNPGGGGPPRRRAMDLAIAATANVAGVPLLTGNAADFKLIADLVHVQETASGY